MCAADRVEALRSGEPDLVPVRRRKDKRYTLASAYTAPPEFKVFPGTSGCKMKRRIVTQCFLNGAFPGKHPRPDLP